MELDRIARMVRELKCDPIYAMFQRIGDVFLGPKPKETEAEAAVPPEEEETELVV